jgi:WD40 repeat protein
MAPEQAGGQARTVGPAADVYALGSILYELLTGRAPFKAATPLDTLLQVVADDPVPPTRLQSRVPRDLETICLKCLHKDAGRRYASAAALADDLRRFLAGEPIQARPVGSLARVLKWARRRPAMAALIAVSVLALVLGVGGLLYFTAELQQRSDATQKALDEAVKQQGIAREAENKATKEKKTAEVQQKLAEARETEAKAQLERSRRLVFAMQLLRVGYVWENDLALARALLYDPDFCPLDLRDFTWGLYDRLCQRNRHNLLGMANALAFAPDGTVLAAATPEGVTLWDPATGRELRTFKGHVGPVTAVAFHPAGKWLASGGEDRTIRFWDTTTGKEVRVLRRQGGPIIKLTFSADGTRLALAEPSGAIQVWDAATGKALRVLHRSNSLGMVALSPDGSKVAAGGYDLVVKVWDADSGKELHTLQGLTDFTDSLAFSPDGKTLAVGYGGWGSFDEEHPKPGEVRLWEVGTGKEQGKLTGYPLAVRSLSFSPDGKTLLTVSRDGTVKAWNLTDRREQALTVKRLQRHVHVAAFSPDGRKLATYAGSGEPVIQLWDVNPGQATWTFATEFHDSLGLSFSRDGKTLASVSYLGSVHLFDAHAGKPVLEQKAKELDLAYAAVSAEARLVAVWQPGDHTEIRLWDVMTGKRRVALKGHIDGVIGAAFDPTGRVLASVSGDGIVKLWDTTTGQELRNLGKTDAVIDPPITFSGDGKWLAVAGLDDAIDLWEIATGKRRIFPVEAHGQIHALALSADGGLLAVGGEGRIITVYQTMEAGPPLARLKGHTIAVAALAFSPDGRTLASGGADRLGGPSPPELKLWSVSTGQELASLQGHKRGIRAVAFRPDGKALASGSQDETIKLWEVADQPERAVLVGQDSRVECLAFSADGTMIAAGGGFTGFGGVEIIQPDKGVVKLWNAVTGQRLLTLNQLDVIFRGVAFSPDGKTLATASEGNDHGDRDKWFGALELWDVPSGKLKATLKGHAPGVTAVAFAPDGKSLASGGRDRTVRLWDPVSGRELLTLSGHTDRVVAVAFSPDGKLLASAAYSLGGAGGEVKVWQTATGKEMHTFRKEGLEAMSLSFSADGKTLAVGQGHWMSPVPGAVLRWDVATGKELPPLVGHKRGVTAVTYSPGGKVLVSAGADWTVRFWDAATGQERGVYVAHEFGVLALAFHPDGRTVASSGADYLIKLWDVRRADD